MVALTAAFGHFHVAQQGVHFVQAQPAVGPHRAVAGHGGQHLVDRLADALAAAVPQQIGQYIAHQRLGIGIGQDHRNLADTDALFAGAIDLQPQLGEQRGRILHQIGFLFAHRQADRHQQRLRGDMTALAGLFQPFVGDALVRGVHVHQHHAGGVFSQNINAVQLRAGETQRRNLRPGALAHALFPARAGRCRIPLLWRHAAVILQRAGNIIGLRRQLAPHLLLGSRQLQRRLAPRHGPGHGHAEAAARALPCIITRGLRRRFRRGGAITAGHRLRLHAQGGGNMTDALRRFSIGAHLGQALVNGLEEKVVHLPALTETHFVLAGMRIDIDQRRVDFQKQHIGRVTAMKQHIGIGLAQGVGHQLVAHDAPVDIEKLHVGLTARKRWPRNPAPQAQAVVAEIGEQRLFDKSRAADACDAFFLLDAGRGGRQLTHHPLVVRQGDGDIEMPQRHALDHIVEMGEFGFFGTQELAPRRHIEEQIAHLHRGAHRMRRRREIRRLAVAHAQPPAVILTAAGLARGQGQLAHRGDAGQGFAAKPQAGDTLEIVDAANLAGGVR